MSTWIYQDDKQVKKHGASKASWYVGWLDPEGKRRCKSCGPGPQGKKNADRLSEKVAAQLVTGTYQDNSRKTWEQFRREYEERVLEGLAVLTRAQVRISLEHFERIVKPVRVSVLRATHIGDFVATRRQERGLRKGDVISPASVNRDLRHIKAALKVAFDWAYLPTMPKFRMEREPKKLPTYVSGEHFAAIYRACETARLPKAANVVPADWWRSLLVMGYMTGWRIADLLAFRRDQLDLDEGIAVSLAEDNKGKRDERVKLHDVVVEHLKRLAGFDPLVFRWNHNIRTIYTEFARIQEAAQVKLPCSKKHEHTRSCYVYGFHDLRRAFATMNADRLTADALQALMRHKTYTTTQRYINMARQMDQAVASLHVPEVLRVAQG